MTRRKGEEGRLADGGVLRFGGGGDITVSGFFLVFSLISSVSQPDSERSNHRFVARSPPSPRTVSSRSRSPSCRKGGICSFLSHVGQLVLVHQRPFSSLDRLPAILEPPRSAPSDIPIGRRNCNLKIPRRPRGGILGNLRNPDQREDPRWIESSKVAKVRAYLVMQGERHGCASAAAA